MDTNYEFHNTSTGSVNTIELPPHGSNHVAAGETSLGLLGRCRQLLSGCTAGAHSAAAALSNATSPLDAAEFSAAGATNCGFGSSQPRSRSSTIMQWSSSGGSTQTMPLQPSASREPRCAAMAGSASAGGRNSEPVRAVTASRSAMEVTPWWLPCGDFSVGGLSGAGEADPSADDADSSFLVQQDSPGAALPTKTARRDASLGAAGISAVIHTNCKQASSSSAATPSAWLQEKMQLARPPVSVPRQTTIQNPQFYECIPVIVGETFRRMMQAYCRADAITSPPICGFDDPSVPAPMVVQDAEAWSAAVSQQLGPIRHRTAAQRRISPLLLAEDASIALGKRFSCIETLIAYFLRQRKTIVEPFAMLSPLLYLDAIRHSEVRRSDANIGFTAWIRHDLRLFFVLMVLGHKALGDFDFKLSVFLNHVTDGRNKDRASFALRDSRDDDSTATLALMLAHVERSVVRCLEYDAMRPLYPEPRARGGIERNSPWRDSTLAALKRLADDGVLTPGAAVYLHQYVLRYMRRPNGEFVS